MDLSGHEFHVVDQEVLLPDRAIRGAAKVHAFPWATRERVQIGVSNCTQWVGQESMPTSLHLQIGYSVYLELFG